MKQESDILSKLGKNPGFKVPENYFADFNKQLMESLPEPQLTPKVAPSLWSRVRPYVYMTAMFAGIWCTMKIFTNLTSGYQKNSMQQVQAIFNGLEDEKNIEDLMLYQNISEYDILTYEDSVEMEQSGIEYIGSTDSEQ